MLRVPLGFLLVFAVATLAAAFWLLRTPALDPKRLKVGEFGQERPFKSKPARELMTSDEHVQYRSALERMECDAADKLLNVAFIREYPEFARAKHYPECQRQDEDCKTWVSYSSNTFRELGLCRTLVDLAKIDEKLRQTSADPPKFVSTPLPQTSASQDSLVQRRDQRLEQLIHQAERDFAPAIEQLANLVARGDVFDASAEAEYYLRTRACHLTKSCANSASRLDALRASMTADRVSLIEWTATADVKRPALKALLTGKRIEGHVVSLLPSSEGLNPRRLLFGEDGSPYRFKSKSAKDLMSGEDYAAYMRALEALDIDAAGKILNEAFLRAYPEFARARQTPGCMEHADCRFLAALRRHEL